MRKGGASSGQELQLRVSQRDPMRHDRPLSQPACQLVQLGVPAANLREAPGMAAGPAGNPGAFASMEPKHLSS